MRENRGRDAALYGSGLGALGSSEEEWRGGLGGVQVNETEMLEPAATFLNDVAMLIARIVGLPPVSQSAI